MITASVELHLFQFLTRRKHSRQIIPAVLLLLLRLATENFKANVVDVIIPLQRLRQRGIILFQPQLNEHHFLIWIVPPQPSDSLRQLVHGRCLLASLQRRAERSTIYSR